MIAIAEGRLPGSVNCDHGYMIAIAEGRMPGSVNRDHGVPRVRADRLSKISGLAAMSWWGCQATVKPLDEGIQIWPISQSSLTSYPL